MFGHGGFFGYGMGFLGPFLHMLIFFLVLGVLFSLFGRMGCHGGSCGYTRPYSGRAEKTSGEKAIKDPSPSEYPKDDYETRLSSMENELRQTRKSLDKIKEKFE